MLRFSLSVALEKPQKVFTPGWNWVTKGCPASDRVRVAAL